MTAAALVITLLSSPVTSTPDPQILASRQAEHPPAPVPAVWLNVADCESGDWIDGGRSFVPGSARWDWGAPGTPLPPWGTRAHHGGLQFAPSTWTWVAPMVGLGHIPHAYDATPAEQVRVAQKVLELQGWDAWPVCSELVGLR